jgi:archaellum biogenesis protein FlaJ (TadC family)
MWEKLGGLATIAIAITVLYLISVFRPPIFVQIICALGGSIICLIGIVFLFAEGQILTKDRKVKKAPKVG